MAEAMECKCVACEESERKLGTMVSPSFAHIPAQLNTEELTLELEWFKPNGITILPNSKETRITSNTYVFLNIFVMHKIHGVIPMEAFFLNGEPQIKMTSTPDWCAKCNRELLSYSPKTPPFSYCKVTKKLLAKFRIICSSNSHFVDKQLISITAALNIGATVLEKSISNIRINSKKPRDEADPSSIKRRRKRKVTTPQGTTVPVNPPPTSGITLDTLVPNHGIYTGNTLVQLKGQFSMESEVMFGPVKLKPFLQKTEVDEEEEEGPSVDTLLCYSPPGAPGSSVQVYVKDGERVSEPLVFVYTASSTKKDDEDKVKQKAGNTDEYTYSVIRELSGKYAQLEQIVVNILQQNGPNSTFKTLGVPNTDNAMITIILKSILVDIMQAKSTLRELEVKHAPKSPFGFLPYGVNPSTLQIMEQYAQVNKKAGNLIDAFSKGQQPDLLSYLPKDNRGPQEFISRENQALSNKIFSQFALPTPVYESAPIPPMRLPETPYDFGVPRSPYSPPYSPPISPPKTSLVTTTTGVGLDRLVAAIETMEKPYP